jgi:multisubunit Na+/H+ antiporter MnhF subunit
VSAATLAASLCAAGVLGLALTAALAAPVLVRQTSLADRVAVVQLLAAKAVAAAVALGVALDEPALVDAGLLLALLGAVAAAIFAQGGGRVAAPSEDAE